MRYFVLFLVVLLSSTSSLLAQVTFDPGYFIDKNGEKVQCVIKNYEWRNAPLQVEYKLTDGSQTKSFSAKEVKGFGVEDYLKYQSAFAQIDTSAASNADMRQLSVNKEPEYKSSQEFLKVIEEGAATLLVYRNENQVQYFIQLAGDTLVPLVYKKYLAKSPGISGAVSENYTNTQENVRFRSQLYQLLPCKKYGLTDAQNLNYRRADLTKWVQAYNEEQGGGSINYHQLQKKRKDLINLFVRAGVRTNSFFMDNDRTDANDAEYDTKIGARVGIQLEYILPYNKNKWAIVFEPTFQYYEDEEVGIFDQPMVLSYQSIELPIGVRYYMFLNSYSKVFVDASIVPDYVLQGDLTLGGEDYLGINSSLSYIFSAGYTYKNRYQASIQYGTGRSLLNQFPTWKSNYQSVSVVLGFNLL